MSSNKGRRDFERLDKKIQVELKKIEFPLNSQELYTCECINISAGGLLLETPRSFEPGDKVQIRLFIPRLNKFHPSYFKVFESTEGQNFLAFGQVARAEEKIPLKKYQIGIEFSDIYEDDWKALYHLLKSEMKQGPA